MVISEEVVERLPGLHGRHDGSLMAILANMLIDVEGGLIGGASLKAPDFLTIMAAAG